MNSDNSPLSNPQRWAWLPLPLLIGAIAVLWSANSRTAYELPLLLIAMNLLFSTLVSLVIAYLAARSFLAGGDPGALMLGCGVLVWGMASSVAAIAVEHGSNFSVTIHNLGVWLSAMCYLAGVVAARPQRPAAPARSLWLAAGYFGAMAVTVSVVLAALRGSTPIFFVQGQGGTPLRQFVLGTTIGMYALTAGLMARVYRRAPSPFLYWYAMGLALLAAGLAGVMLQSVQGSLLGWSGRLAQFAGGAYLLVAAVEAARASDVWWIPASTSPEENLRQSEFMAAVQHGSPLWWVLRYGLALVAVAAGFGLRTASTAWIGPGLPTYITFYPAVMVAALLAGVGPGLLATVLAAAATAYWILPPVGFAVASTVERVGIVLFMAMGLFMSAVAELYRRDRRKAAAYDRELALHQGREALRKQVELIDPVRAEIIAREMQRVVLERGAASAAPAEPTSDMLRRVPAVAGAAVAALGALVLVGWVYDVAALKRVVPGLASMKFNTALCLLLSGAALAWRDRRVVRWTCAAAVGLVAALSLAEYLTGTSFDLDQLFIRDLGDSQTVPGRMAQSTATCFILTALSLLLTGARARAALWAQQVAALVAGMVGLVALLGYAYGVEQFYGLAGFSSMALHTAAAFTVLGAGLLCTRATGMVAVLIIPGPGAQLARLLLPAVILVPVFAGWLHVHGEKTGLFEPIIGAGLFAITMILVFAVLVWWTARALNRTDLARRETETQLRNLTEVMDNSHEPLIVREPGGRIRSWNRGAEALYDWPAAEVLGQRSDALLRIEGHSVEEIDRQLKITGRWEGELVHTTRDGRRVIVESRQTSSPIGDGRVLVLESNLDITERKRAEEELKKARAELEARVEERTAELRDASRYARGLIEASLDSLVTISPGGKITDVNHATELVTGVDREQLIGSNFSGYFTDPEQANKGYTRVIREGLVRDYPLTIRHVSGRTTDVLYNATVYRNEAGVIQGVFAAARDITERRKAEAELAGYRDHLEDLVKQRTGELETANVQLEAEIAVRKSTEETLRRTAEELARSNQELEQYAYVASHDLQEPLRAVSGYLGLIENRLQNKLDERDRLHIDGALQGAARMHALITDLLTLSRVGKQGKAFEPTDLNAVLGRALQSVSASLQEAGAQVTRDPLPTLRVDGLQMTQLFQNLLGNAVKFRGGRSPDIHVSAERQADGEWLFAVRDNGIGIEPQYWERIFLIFQRLHTRKEYPGTGIGLALCRKIVERHGGRIWVESQPGQGSTFYFTIPDQ